MRPILPVTLLTIMALAAAPLPSIAPDSSTPSGAIDVEEHCSSLDPPAAVAAPVVHDTTTIVPLHVRVLLDVAEAPQITALRTDGDPNNDADAEALLAAVVAELAPNFEGAIETYARLAIDLQLSYDVLSTGDDAPSSTVELIAQAKEQYGGAVPSGVDVVYVATDNLVEGTVAGQADCVGGMAYDEHSFASGRVDRPEEPLDFLGATFFAQTNVIVFAHEVGHLLGAHHHFTNCAESMAHYPGPSDVLAVCGLMINDVGLAGDVFSTVNSVVVRGYANEFAGS